MARRLNILLTGANGQLGQQFKELFSTLENPIRERFNLIPLGREELDITDKKELLERVESNQIDIILNCAAYTAVDRAEEEREQAFLVNGEAVANMAKVAKEKNVLLLHISTDYIFSGENSTPYIESDSPAPINCYGQSKLAGEEAIVKEGGRYIILRSGWLYSLYGVNFVKKIVELSKEHRELKVVFDQVGTPTYCGDLAEATIDILLQYISWLESGGEKHFPFGVYNFSNEGVASWYDIAIEIVNFMERESTVLPVRSDQFPTIAKRPKYSILDKGLIKENFSLEIPHWRESLLALLSKLQIR